MQNRNSHTIEYKIDKINELNFEIIQANNTGTSCNISFFTQDFKES